MSTLPILPKIAVDELAGCNRLLDEAYAGGAEAVVLTTAQLSVHQQTMEELHRVHMAHPRAIAGCRVMDASHTTHFLLPGWRWSAADCEWHSEWSIEIKPDPTAPAVLSYDWLNPDVLLIPRTAWDTVGHFDPALSSPLAAVDWCLRARKAGFQCYEVQTAFALKQPPPTERRVPWGPTHLPDLPGMLILAGKHQLPTGRMRLAWQFMHKAISEELGRVRFSADYGCNISLVKRTAWYLRNLFLAIKRARIPAMILSVFKHLIATPQARNSP